jgi:hypothetical protein
MTKIVSENQAKQGEWGGRVLLILVAALVLALVAWGGAEFYGEMIKAPTTGDQTQATPGK